MRVRRRRRLTERRSATTPDERDSMTRSALVMRERLRRVAGQPPRMDEATFAAERAWHDAWADDRLARWRADHGMEIA